VTEVLFYHLEHQPLDRVLPNLLERTLERGWRAVVQCGSPERCEALDTLLWTYREESFLPHGTAKDGPATDHPIYLTAEDDNPGQAQVRFLVDGAVPGSFEGFEQLSARAAGRDSAAVEQARSDWRRVRGQGLAVTYWQQAAGGRWEKRA